MNSRSLCTAPFVSRWILRAARPTRGSVVFSAGPMSAAAPGTEPQCLLGIHLPQPHHVEPALVHDAAAQDLPVRQLPRPRLLHQDDRGQDGQPEVNREERGVFEAAPLEPLAVPHLELEVPDVALPPTPQLQGRVDPATQGLQLRHLRRDEDGAGIPDDAEQVPRPQPKQLLEGAIRIHGEEATAAKGQRRSGPGPPKNGIPTPRPAPAD